MCLKKDQGSGGECFLLSKVNGQKEIKGCPAWYFANRDARGYYRTFYEDHKNLENLTDVAEKALSTPERIALVEDTWAMTRAGRYPIGVSMHLFEALHSDHEPIILGSIFGHLRYAERLLTPEQEHKFRNFVRSQYSPMAHELGWEPRSTDTDEQKQLRASLLSILGEAGDPDAVAAAQKITEQYLQQPNSTDPTLTGAALFVAAEHGTPKLYDAMTEAMNKAKSSNEYYSLLFTLCSFEDPELGRRTLQLVDSGKVRQQDYPGFFNALLGNSATRAETWEYLKKHWDTLAENTVSFGGRGSVSGLGSFCTEKDKEDVKQFFSTHRAPGAERALQQSLDAMDNCMEFKKLQQANMEKWLASQEKSSGGQH
jgi:aminopeptidase N